MRVRLRLTGRQHTLLREHLFPGDGLEGVAVALCGRRRAAADHDLLVRRIVPIPHAACERHGDRVTWPSSSITDALNEALQRDLAVVKFHSHPDGSPRFSSLDDASDRRFFDGVFGWTDTSDPHASAIVLPGGEVVGRAILPSGDTRAIERVAIAGDDLVFWDAAVEDDGTDEGFAVRTRQAFGSDTVARMRRLCAAVVGCSGTGSIVAEMLTRLGVGQLVLVDADVVEEKNLSRILNATRADALARRPKVDVLVRALSSIDLGTRFAPLQMNLVTPEAVRAVAGCDVVFGCMDSVEGRHVLNRLAACYVLPYFDMGVRLDADGRGGVAQVCCAVNYLQPDGSTLLSRGVYTMGDVEAEALRRSNPTEYDTRRREGYIHGVREDSPAVISINGFAASIAVNEFLARLHPYRLDPNAEFARVQVSLSHGFSVAEPEGPPDMTFAPILGRGDSSPLLQMPGLSET